MFKFFNKKSKQIECKFCNKSIDKSSSFVLQYKASDGIGTITACVDCSNILNDIISIRDSLND